MSTWISLHQAGLLGLMGLLAAILLINWQLGPEPPSARVPAARARRPPGTQGRAPDPEPAPATENRAMRRRAAGKRVLR